MKKTMKTLLALMAGVMTFSACSNEDVLINETPNVKPEVEGIRTFTAFTESDGASRATIDGFDVKWQSGDAISVVVDVDEYDKYNLTAGEGTTSGTFVANGSGVYGSDIYAVYPYRADVAHYVTQAEAYGIVDSHGFSTVIFDKILDGTATQGQMTNFNNSGAADDPWIIAYLNNDPIMVPAYTPQGSNGLSGFVIPSTQTVSGEEVVDPKAVVMVAKADDMNNLQFKNVCSYIKVTPTVALKKIVVSANNGESLADNDLYIDNVTTFTSYFVHDGSSSVTLQANAGNLAADKTYYIAVVPGTLASGLSIKFYTDNSNYTEKSTSSSFTFVRNKVHSAGSQPTE